MSHSSREPTVDGGGADHIIVATPVFPVLDTLRAVGALAVLTTHTSFQSGDYVGHGVWGTVLSRLDSGVAIFFVLSGFLLSRPYLARAAAGLPRPGLGRYYRNRALRILPVYVVSVVIALILVDQDAPLQVVDWVRAVTLVDIYFEPMLPQGLTQMWSLAVEVSFYVLLPVLMLIGAGPRLRVRRLLLLLAAMVAVSVAWHLGLAQRVDDVSPGLPLSWLPGYLSWFAIGIALALAHVHSERSPDAPWVRRLQLLGSMPGACWAAAGGLLLLAATPLAGPSALFVASAAQSVFKHVDYAVIAGLIVLTGVFTVPGSRYLRWMSLPLARHLGHISYSIFCIHLVVLHAVMALGDFELFRGHGLTIWLLTVVFSLGAAELLYRLVERPFMRLKGRANAAVPDQPNDTMQVASTQ